MDIRSLKNNSSNDVKKRQQQQQYEPFVWVHWHWAREDDCLHEYFNIKIVSLCLFSCYFSYIRSMQQFCRLLPAHKNPF